MTWSSSQKTCYTPNGAFEPNAGKLHLRVVCKSLSGATWTMFGYWEETRILPVEFGWNSNQQCWTLRAVILPSLSLIWLNSHFSVVLFTSVLLLSFTNTLPPAKPSHWPLLAWRNIASAPWPLLCRAPSPIHVPLSVRPSVRQIHLDKEPWRVSKAGTKDDTDVSKTEEGQREQLGSLLNSGPLFSTDCWPLSPSNPVTWAIETDQL